MAYLCDIYTDEDEYEIYLEQLLMGRGNIFQCEKTASRERLFFLSRKNGRQVKPIF